MASTEDGHSPSAKSTTSVPIRPEGTRKQVGFARPTLYIPSPQPHPFTPRTATLSVPPSSHHEFYDRKASMFMFNGIRDFTMNTAKSGLGMGEKSAYWMYGKLRAWSRKWFTHIFLSLVLLIYTVGGAIMFITIEGYNEDQIVLVNLRKEEYAIIRELRQLSVTVPIEKSDGEWEGEALRKLKVFEAKIIDAFVSDQLIMANGGERKMWTFWNSVVYCSTIYTTIESMYSLQTTSNDLTKQNDEDPEKRIDMSRIEAMVTAEQVFSASVSRKRRTFTKKRSASSNRTREQTPVRQMTNDADYENESNVRPKTPERRRRKSKVDEHNGDAPNSNSNHFGENQEPFYENVIENHARPKNFLEELKGKTDSFADFAQIGVKNFVTKTKETLAVATKRGRDLRKKRHKEEVKRSQSEPHEFTQQELLESFRRAQLIEEDGSENKRFSLRKYSDSSLRSLTPSEDTFVPKPFRPEVKEFVRQRKKERQFSNRIIEVLDPETSKVITTKTLIRQNVGLCEFFHVLRVFSFLEILREYKIYKTEMHNECQRIRYLRNKCFSELFLVFVFCGCGGFMFKFTEGSFENYYKCGVKRVKRDFIDLLWIRSHNLREDEWKSLARNKLRLFEEELHMAHEAGMTSYSGQRSWSFLNAIVYSLTVISTIGYGHIYPTTLTGRVLTIVYSIIGIPLFLIALTDFGKLFTRCIKFLWSYVRRLYYRGNCRRVRKTQQVQEIFKGAQMMYDIATFRRPSTVEDPEIPQTPNTFGDDTPTTPALSNFEIDDQFNLPISIAIFILLLYIFLGAFIYCVWEGWDFFKSFYFVFISMSTIGFGDVVPKDPICTIVSIVYLVFGLALMSMCINVVQEKLSDTFKHASAKIGATIGWKMSEDGSISTVPPDPVELPAIHLGPNEVTELEKEQPSPVAEKIEVS